MQFRVESAGGVASTVQVGPHRLLFDQPASNGGEGRGPSPLPVLAVAVGACAHYYAAAFLTRRGLPVGGLVVDVAYDKATEGRERLAHLSVDVRLPAGFPEKYVSAVERAVRGCPAYGTLVEAPQVDLRVTPAREARAEAAPAG